MWKPAYGFSSLRLKTIIYKVLSSLNVFTPAMWVMTIEYYFKCFDHFQQKSLYKVIIDNINWLVITSPVCNKAE